MVKKIVRSPRGEPDLERDAGADPSLDLPHLEASQVPGPQGLRHQLLLRGHLEDPVQPHSEDGPSLRIIQEPLQSTLTFLHLLVVPAGIAKNGSLKVVKKKKKRKRRETKRKREKKRKRKSLT